MSRYQQGRDAWEGTAWEFASQAKGSDWDQWSQDTQEQPVCVFGGRTVMAWAALTTPVF